MPPEERRGRNPNIGDRHLQRVPDRLPDQPEGGSVRRRLLPVHHQPLRVTLPHPANERVASSA